MFEYNKETMSEKYDYTWRHLSRNNYYFFYTENGQKDIVTFIDELQIKSILDYGCGNNDLKYVLGESKSEIECVGYDPYVTLFSNKPTEAKELTVCYNVLQSIENDKMYEVINDIHTLTKKYLLLHIGLGGFFGRDEFYYENLFTNIFSNLFKVISKHTQNNEIVVLKKNLDTGEIFHNVSHKRKTSFFLLERI